MRMETSFYPSGCAYAVGPRRLTGHFFNEAPKFRHQELVFKLSDQLESGRIAVSLQCEDVPTSDTS